MDNLSRVNLDGLNISSTNFTTAAVTVASTPTTASLNISRWQLDDSINGPVIAALVGSEFILSLLSNLFILTHGILHRESLKKSSTIFLFNLSLSNLIATVLYIDFYIISSGAEEWIFGSTDFVRNILCQFHGFAFAFTTNISLHTLAAISFDRFLSIVKPHHHKRFLTWKVALGITVFLWLLALILDLSPYFNLGLGNYDWSISVGGCIPRWIGNRTYVIIVIILSSIPFIIISITSAWTFLFTRRFLRQNFRRQKRTLDPENIKVQEHIYSASIRNLIGIFGMLLLFNILTLSPFVIVSIVGPIIGLDRIPHQIYAAILVLFLFSNVTNPIIQVYFRKDLYDIIKKYFMRIASFLKRRLREVEDQEVGARSRTTESSSLETGVVIGKGENVERDMCEDTIVMQEVGEGGSRINSSCNCQQLLIGVNFELPVTEEESVAVSLDVNVECKGGEDRSGGMDEDDM